MTADQPLALWPDEADVELPLDDAEQELADAQASDAVRDKLVDELAACLSWAEGRTTPNASRVRYWRTLVGRPAVVDEAATPEERRDEGIARAAAKWTDDEVALVDAAIRAIVDELRERQRTIIAKQRAAGYRFTDDAFPQTFTTARVWARLDGAVPITKGIAGRMIAARSAGLIKSTGRTTTPPKDAPGPNNGQRLTVWEVLPA